MIVDIPELQRYQYLYWLLDKSPLLSPASTSQL